MISEVDITQGNKESLFKNKIVLVTGSGRGIGKVIALTFASLGAHVIVNYFRNPDPAKATVEAIKKLGCRALLIKANLGEMDEVGKIFSTIEDEFGGLDIFIHNAASGYNRPAMQQRVKGWDWTMNINARSFLFASQHAAMIMKKQGGGHIVCISSPGANRVLADYVVVGASKAALESLTRYLAVELAPMNIVVNAVSPGLVETDALKFFSATSEKDIIKHAVELTPAGRLTTPEDVANVVTFLCSPAANMIRGQVIIVDGGYTLPAR